MATFDDQDLQAARDAGLLTNEGLEGLRAFLRSRGGKQAEPLDAPRPSGMPRFDLTHVLWYAGALIVIAAMGLFTNEAFNKMGGMALILTGLVYALVFWLIGHALWRRDLRTPGGLALTVAVSMVPMIIYGVQDAWNLWDYAKGNPGEYRNFFPYIHGSWVYMELGAILAALVALRFYPFPFLVSPIAVALWFMSMDIARWLIVDFDNHWNKQALVSVYFGLAVMVVAWAVDLRRARTGDHAFWLHLFGVMAFWGGLSAMQDSTELGRAAYCLINVVLVMLGVFLRRRVHAVFGAIGVATYVEHLASKVFKDVLAFSFVLSLIGLAIIGAGLLYYRNQARLSAAIDAAMPAFMRALRPRAT